MTSQALCDCRSVSNHAEGPHTANVGAVCISAAPIAHKQVTVGIQVADIADGQKAAVLERIPVALAIDVGKGRHQCLACIDLADGVVRDVMSILIENSDGNAFDRTPC